MPGPTTLRHSSLFYDLPNTAGYEHRHRTGHEKEHRADQHHREIVRNLPAQAPRLLDPPDIVKGVFDIGKDLDDGVEEDKEPQTCNETTLHVFKQRVSEIDDFSYDLLLPHQALQKKLLQCAFEPETFGNPENHGGNRNDREKRIKGKGGSPQPYSFAQNPPNREDNNSQGP